MLSSYAKAEKILFFSVLFFLPSQLGKHFWPQFSLVEGIRIDYLSPTLYLTDILILLLFATHVSSFLTIRKGKISNIKYQKSKILSTQFLIGLFVVLVCIGSIIFSLSPLAGVYKLLKISEFIFLAWYIAQNISLKKDLPKILGVFSMGVVGESLLTILQFVKQGSLGGPFWLFGERMFSGQTPGIANAHINGELLLRPYGTFPHPNVLAGYLVIAMTLIVSSIKYQVSSIRRPILGFAIVLGTIALVLTLSRVAIVLWFVILFFWLLKQTKKKLAVGLLLLMVCIAATVTPLVSRFTSLVDADRETITRRQALNTAAFTMFQKSPLLGVGLNNFLVELPRFQKPVAGPLWLQPVHNIYLLVLAETGIVGFLFFLWFIWKTFKRSITVGHSLIIPLIIIVILGLFDHYFLTLQQGQLLFTVLFGLAFAKAN